MDDTHPKKSLPAPTTAKEWGQQPMWTHISDILAVIYDVPIGLAEIPDGPNGKIHRREFKSYKFNRTIDGRECPFTEVGTDTLLRHMLGTPDSRVSGFSYNENMEAKNALLKQFPQLQNLAPIPELSPFSQTNRWDTLQTWMNDQMAALRNSGHSDWYAVMPVNTRAKSHQLQVDRMHSSFPNVSGNYRFQGKRFKVENESAAKQLSEKIHTPAAVEIAQAIVALSKLGKDTSISPKEMADQNRAGEGLVLEITSSNEQLAERRFDLLKKYFTKMKLDSCIDQKFVTSTDEDGDFTHSSVITINLKKMLEQVPGFDGKTYADLFVTAVQREVSSKWVHMRAAEIERKRRQRNSDTSGPDTLDR